MDSVCNMHAKPLLHGDSRADQAFRSSSGSNSATEILVCVTPVPPPLSRAELARHQFIRTVPNSTVPLEVRQGQGTQNIPYSSWLGALGVASLLTING